jgi:hypothetical protein
VRQPNRLVRCAGQKHLVSGSASAVAVAISAPFHHLKRPNLLDSLNTIARTRAALVGRTL